MRYRGRQGLMVAPARGDAMDAVGVRALEGLGDGRAGDLVEEVLGDLDGCEVADDEGDEHGEESGWERREPECVVEWTLGDQGADCHHGEDRSEQRSGRSASE